MSEFLNNFPDQCMIIHCKNHVWMLYVWTHSRSSSLDMGCDRHHLSLAALALSPKILCVLFLVIHPDKDYYVSILCLHFLQNMYFCDM